MIEPVAPTDMLISFVSAACVILFGAGYAALFAWSRLKQRRSAMRLAYGSYALLAGAVAVLAQTNHLDGQWQMLVFAMLIGYLLAPHAIWKLVTATHQDEP